MPRFHRILSATDFSAGAEHALDCAIDVARAFTATLVIAHIYAPPVLVVPDEVVVQPVDLAAVTASIQAGLDERARRARSLGVERVETAFGSGSPADELLRIVKEQRCDLIVTGTRGRGAVARFFLGSVADRILRRADCPVLTVGPRAQTVN